jgi:hypothetical protein
MNRLFVFILFLLMSAPLFAQDDEETGIDAGGHLDPRATKSFGQYMKEDIGSKKFDEKKWKETIGDMNFEEKAEKEKKEDVKEKEETKNGSGSGFFSLDPNTTRLISFIVIFCLFAFILYYVAQNTRFNRKKKLKKMTPQDVAAHVENIEELDTDGLLRQALQTGDLRMAVRIHYLLLLKKLNEVGLIAWKKDKTNRDYLSELYGRNDCYDNVRGLTLAYELVWYGERSVSNESFQRLSGEFESVNRVIKDVQPNE